jgi:hypothetical protein
MKFTALALVALLLSDLGMAGDVSAVAGHYRYEQYAVTLPNGRMLGLKDLGASEAFLDVSQDGITLRIIMKAGNTVVQTAKLIDSHIVNGVGYWLVQWPDMRTPVKAQITLKGDVLTSESRFDDKSDAERYGSIERAVLKRVSGN